MTFTDLYAVWEAEKRNTLRPMSYSTYAVLLERFILPRLGDNEAITEEDVDAFLRNHTHQYLPVRLLLQEGPTARHRAANTVGTITCGLDYYPQEQRYPRRVLFCFRREDPSSTPDAAEKLS